MGGDLFFHFLVNTSVPVLKCPPSQKSPAPPPALSVAKQKNKNHAENIDTPNKTI